MNLVGQYERFFLELRIDNLQLVQKVMRAHILNSVNAIDE